MKERRRGMKGRRRGNCGIEGEVYRRVEGEVIVG